MANNTPTYSSASNTISSADSLVPLGTFDATTGVVLTGYPIGIVLSDAWVPENGIYVAANAGNWHLGNVTSWKAGDQAYSRGYSGGWTKIETGSSSGSGGSATDVTFTPTPSIPGASNVQEAIDYLAAQSAPQYTSLGPVAATYSCMYQDSTTGQIGLAQANSAATAECIGFALDGALASGQPINAQSSGYVTNSAWNFTIAQPVYLSPTVAGGVTQVAPVSGEYFMQLGVASAVDTIRINLIYNGLVW